MTTIPGITPITPPSIPAVTPLLPLMAAGSPTVPAFDPARRALALALLLKRVDKLDQVTADVRLHTWLERQLILGALVSVVLTHRQLEPQARLLRNVIRFVQRNPQLPPRNPTFHHSGGTKVSTTKFKAPAANPHLIRSVDLHTNVHVRDASLGESHRAYSLTYSGSDADDVRWLQFIWRMVVPEHRTPATRPAVLPSPMKGRLVHAGTWYHLTTDPGNPRWTTDSGRRTAAFYEEFTAVERTNTTLAMFDFSSSDETIVTKAFALSPRPTHVVSHFRAAVYLVRRMEVVYRADIEIAWEYAASSSATLGAPAYTMKRPTAALVKSLDPAHRAVLARQHPEVDYLPGVVGAPVALSDFDLVTSATMPDWYSLKKSNVTRLTELAKLASADLVDDVPDLSLPIKVTSQVQPGNTETDPGLNYSEQTFKNVTAVGETGYIDNVGAYHNPDLPVGLGDHVPRIAIILIKNTFEKGADQLLRDWPYPLATLRHEMLHAAHYELAIGWYLKWLDAITDQSFHVWLDQQLKDGKLTRVEFALVSTGVTGDLKATEALASMEGVLTAAPFLPYVPDIVHLKKQDDWPAAVSALKEAGKEYHSLLAGPVDQEVKAALLDRIRRASCRDLTPVQRTSLTDWATHLLNPASLDPTNSFPDEVRLLTSFFGPVQGFLRDVIQQVSPCP